MAEGRRQLALVACALTAQALAFFWTPLLFTNDGPQHLLTAHVLVHHEEPDAPFFGDWEISTTLTDHGYKQAYALFHTLLGWEDAHAAASWLPLAMSLFGWCLLARGRPHFGLRVALLAGLSIPWHFWIGLLPYQYSLAVTPFALMLALGGPLTARREAVLSLLLLLQCACHPLPAMLTGGMAFVIAALADWRQALRMVVVGIPAATVALGTSVGVAPSEGATVWHWEGGPLRQLLGLYIPGPSAFRVVLILILVGLVIAAVRRLGTRPRPELALLGIALVGVLATPFLPYQWRGWELVGSRFLPLCVPLLVAMLPFSVPRAAFFIAGGVAAWSGAYLAWVATTATELDAAYRDIYDPLRERMSLVSLKRWDIHIYDMIARPDVIPDIEYYGGQAHLAQILALEKGGVPSFTQADDPVLHGIIARTGPPRRPGQGQIKMGEPLELWEMYRDSPHTRRTHIQAMLAYAERHDVMIVAGSADDLQAVGDAGYDVTPLGSSPSGLHLGEATFRGCRVELLMDVGARELVEIGVLPRPGQIEAFFASPGGDSWVTPPLPCGNWWIRGGAPFSDGPTEYARFEARDGASVEVRHTALQASVRPDRDP